MSGSVFDVLSFFVLNLNWAGFLNMNNKTLFQAQTDAGPRTYKVQPQTGVLANEQLIWGRQQLPSSLMRASSLRDLQEFNGWSIERKDSTSAHQSTTSSSPNEMQTHMTECSHLVLMCVHTIFLSRLTFSACVRPWWRAVGLSKHTPTCQRTLLSVQPDKFISLS